MWRNVHCCWECKIAWKLCKTVWWCQFHTYVCTQKTERGTQIKFFKKLYNNGLSSTIHTSQMAEAIRMSINR